MIETSALLAWCALALLVTVTPGPDTFLVATQSARGGFRAGLATTLGVTSGGVFYAALFGFGLLPLLVAIPMLFLAVKIAGALYLLWLGVSMVARALSREEKAARGGVRHADLGGPYLQGLLNNILNPKVALFYLAALPQFASGADAALVGAVLIAIHGVFGLVWLSGVALAASHARRAVKSSLVGRWLEGAVGTFFVAAANRLAWVQR